ncbi:MAG TPA: hypothetical protein EYP91_08260, partial [Gammaproteobacteria bacterium]|nr:hypothetical protein [Gammaproteobacteria bacterium]
MNKKTLLLRVAEIAVGISITMLCGYFIVDAIALDRVIVRFHHHDLADSPKSFYAALVPRPRSNLTRYFYRIGGSLRPTRHSGGQWSLVQRNRRAKNQ